MSEDELKSLIEEIVSVTRWHSGYAQVVCPSEHQARVYFDRGFPYLHCLHTRCAEDVAALNHELRERAAELSGSGKVIIGLTPEEERAKAFWSQLRRITRDTQRITLPKILEGPDVLIETLMGEAGLDGHEDSVTQQRLLLSLFQPDETVWIGDKTDTGDPWYQSQFQQVHQWSQELPLPKSHQLICPAAFRRGSWRRSDDNAFYRRFLIYEADHLSFSDQLKVLVWLRRFLVLRAIVFSGNKSLHCWFDKPRFADGEVYRGMRKLEARLIGLDADKNMFRTSATTRFCGVERFDEKAGAWTGKQQQLMYIKIPGVAETIPASPRCEIAYDNSNVILFRQ